MSLLEVDDSQVDQPRRSVDTYTSGVRLQKVLAQAGVGSRRACEELISEGRVRVDGRVIREQGVRVDQGAAVVTVDGRRIPTVPGGVYLALNKPRGVLSAMSDQQGRRCVGDLVADRAARLFHVGRLDVDTEGLLLLTNDGDLAHRLAHPSFGVSKVYLAEVPAPVPPGLGRQLREGVMLEDGVARVDAFRVVQSHAGRALVELHLHEGRQRIVRRLMAAVGHPVGRLVRLQVGPIRLGDMRPGSVRPLNQSEVMSLLTLVD
ncbi:MAG: pseudouridine synthase [Actinomycetes bacterium]